MNDKTSYWRGLLSKQVWAKAFRLKNEGRHWGCEWEVIDEEKVTDRRGKTRKIRRVAPVRAKNSRYMPHQGGGMRSQT